MGIQIRSRSRKSKGFIIANRTGMIPLKGYQINLVYNLKQFSQLDRGNKITYGVTKLNKRRHNQ